jgi:F-type H+-transporting ATPase subunit epsilon
MPLDLEVVTPEREIAHEQVAEVQIPGLDGYLGVLPGHAPLLSKLGIGKLSYSAGGHWRNLAVHGGFLEIRDDHVRVLADAAERPEEIDVERARRAEERARQRELDPHLGLDPADAVAAVLRAETRIAVARERHG